MKTWLLILLLVSGSLPSFADGIPDEKKTAWRLKADSLVARMIPDNAAHNYPICVKLSEGYIAIAEADKADHWANKALETARMNKNAVQEIDAIRISGNVQEMLRKNYRAALTRYIEAADLAAKNNLVNKIHELYISILNLDFYLGDFVSAMRHVTTGLHLAEQAGDERLVAHYQGLTGFIHLRQNNPNAAEKYYLLYLGHAQRTGDSVMIGDAFTSLAECAIAKADFVKGMSLSKQALQIFQSLYQQGKLNQVDRVPYALFKTGYCYGSQQLYKEAMKYVLDAIRHTETFPSNLYDIAQYKLYAGKLYLETKSYAAAHAMLHDGLSLSLKIEHKENIRDGYFYLQELFARKKQYDSAFFYNRLYNELKDSILNVNTQREIEQIGLAYALEKKDNQIKILEQQKKLQEAKIKRQLLWRNIVLLVTALLMLLVVFALNRNYLKRKNRLQEEINTRQNEIFNISSTVQDHERKRIAKDLHDGMGTLLSAAKMKLSAMPQPVAQVQDTLVLLDDAITELRNISQNLMPATLSKLGLVAALQNLFDKIQSVAHLQINLVVHGFTERLPEEKEMVLYRVILELVNNVVKHSGADLLTVQLVKYPEEVVVTVEDNGKGFGSEAFEKAGIGLTNIRSRINYLEGHVHIDSRKGSGTTVIIDIPV